MSFRGNVFLLKKNCSQKFDELLFIGWPVKIDTFSSYFLVFIRIRLLIFVNLFHFTLGEGTKVHVELITRRATSLFHPYIL